MDARSKTFEPVSSQPRTTHWFIVLLFVMMTCSYIDRAVLNILVQPIKEEMRLTDLQIGLVGGLGFAILFIAAGVPVARLAERLNRVTIITVAVVLWSVATALCGVTQSYWQLFLARVGVGVGEAASGPPAQSLIADYYPPHRRASAVSIYTLGIPAGGILGTVIGGAIGQAFGWRVAFFALGFPGLLIAAAFRLVLREPVRGLMDRAGVETGPAPGFGAVIRRLLTTKSFLHAGAGAAIANFTSQGFGLFLASYFVRRFGVGVGEVGLAVGMVGGLSSAIGIIGGGFLSDWAGRFDRRWYGWLPAIGLLIACPVYFLVLSQTSWPATVWVLALPGVFMSSFIAPLSAITQNVLPPRMRATAFALLFSVTSFVGVALGPLAAGWLADMLSANAFAPQAAGSFHALCVLAHKAPPACRVASATGLREALLILLLPIIWAAVHFFLASRSLRADQASLAGS